VQALAAPKRERSLGKWRALRPVYRFSWAVVPLCGMLVFCHVGSTKRKVLTREPSAARPVWTAWTCGSGTRWSHGRSRQEQAGTDVGLQEQAQIVEVMLPAAALVPRRMGLQRRGVARVLGRRRLGRSGRQGSGGDVAQRGAVRGLQTHQRVGAHDQFPPALNAGRVRHAVVRPAQIVLTVFETV
jgi:hypothetical protein